MSLAIRGQVTIYSNIRIFCNLTPIFLPGLENEDVHIPNLFYALIVQKYNTPVVRAEETLTAEATDQHTAQLLNIKLGEPVLVLNRVTYTTGNTIIEIRNTKGRSDNFSYKTEIR